LEGENHMKGIILAGGTGSRLYPLTKVTNKHLLPVYDKPMIYYPLRTLLTAGVTDIMIVSGRGHAGHFLELLGSGADFGARFTYEIQDEAGGIAQALSLAEDFADDEDVAVILGDNIFQDNVKDAVQSFNSGARIFLKLVMLRALVWLRWMKAAGRSFALRSIQMCQCHHMGRQNLL